MSATADDIAWWETHRPDIARYLSYEGGKAKIWVDPITGKALDVCPWINEEVHKGSAKPRYSCNIYHDRPEDCRHYPVNITEMVIDECEMLELTDLTDTTKAQKRLDQLMADSRPPSA